MGTLLKNVSKLIFTDISKTKQVSTSSRVSSRSPTTTEDTESNSSDGVNKADSFLREKRKPAKGKPEVKTIRIEKELSTAVEVVVVTEPEPVESRGGRGGERKRATTTRRKVNFEDDVTVHGAIVDDNGNRESFCERGRLKAASSTVERRQATLPTPPNRWTAANDRIYKDPDLRYQITRDSSTGCRLLNFHIYLGPLFSGGATVMAKTNASGDELDLVAHRAAAVSSSRRTRSSDVYCDSFPLPVVVDPDRLTVVVNTDGRVSIEAPVIAPADPLLERWTTRRHPKGTQTTKERKKRRGGD